MTLSLSQANLTQGSISLPLLFICVEINVCMLSSVSRNGSPQCLKLVNFQRLMESLEQVKVSYLDLCVVSQLKQYDDLPVLHLAHAVTMLFT